MNLRWRWGFWPEVHYAKDYEHPGKAYQESYEVDVVHVVKGGKNLLVQRRHGGRHLCKMAKAVPMGTTSKQKQSEILTDRKLTYLISPERNSTAICASFATSDCSCGSTKIDFARTVTLKRPHIALKLNSPKFLFN